MAFFFEDNIFWAVFRSTYDRGGKKGHVADDLRFILIDCEEGQIACSSVNKIWL